jgi:hypothetical protein
MFARLRREPEKPGASCCARESRAQRRKGPTAQAPEKKALMPRHRASTFNTNRVGVECTDDLV